MAIFDPKRPVESFKALVLDLMKGYRFDVEGLYLKDGTVRPLPSEVSRPHVRRTSLSSMTLLPESQPQSRAST